MKRDGMKIGLLVALVAASGAVYYSQYASEPKRVAQTLTPEEQASYEQQVRFREAIAKLPGYTEAGS